MNKIIDISIPYRVGMIHWPGDIPFTRIQRTQIGIDNAVSNDSVLIMSAHCGTHVDAPRHFFLDGQSTDKIDLSVTVGPVYVLDCSEYKGPLDEKAFERVPQNTQRLLVKTSNGQSVRDSKFKHEFVGLSTSGAEWLKKEDILLFGLDYCSIGALSDGSIAEAHRIFLSRKDAVALEGIDLSAVKEGAYYLVCLPLAIEGCDGSPCRAILIEEVLS